jgi:hypothetical protein
MVDVPPRKYLEYRDDGSGKLSFDVSIVGRRRRQEGQKEHGHSPNPPGSVMKPPVESWDINVFRYKTGPSSMSAEERSRMYFR